MRDINTAMPAESRRGGGGDGGEGEDINLAELDITTTEHSFEDVDGHIQANLEDEIVKEALDKVCSNKQVLSLVVPNK